MSKRGLSLKVKLVLTISLVIFIFGGAATISVYVYIKQILTSQEYEKLESSVVAKASEIERVLESNQAIAQTIAELPDVISFMSERMIAVDQDDDYLDDGYYHNFADEEHIMLSLNNFNIGQYYSAIYLMDDEGNTLISTDPNFIGKNYSFRSYFQKPLTTGQPSINVARGVTSKQLGYYFSAPIKSQSSNFLGVVVIKMNPDSLHHLVELNSIKIGNADYMLTDIYGVVLQSNKSRKIFSSLGQMSEDNLRQIQEERIYEGLEIKSLDYQSIQNDLGLIEEFKFYEIYDDIDGEKELVVIASVLDSSFYILLEDEFAVINDAVNYIATLLSIFVLLSSLVAAAIISMAVSRFISPVKDLQVFAKNIMSGHLRQKIRISSHDEFGQLAHSLNKMALRLRKNQVSTEKKIEERTEKLESLNSSMIGRELKMLELKREVNRLKKK